MRCCQASCACANRPARPTGALAWRPAGRTARPTPQSCPMGCPCRRLRQNRTRSPRQKVGSCRLCHRLFRVHAQSPTTALQCTCSRHTSAANPPVNCGLQPSTATNSAPRRTTRQLTAGRCPATSPLSASCPGWLAGGGCITSCSAARRWCSSRGRVTALLVGCASSSPGPVAAAAAASAGAAGPGSAAAPAGPPAMKGSCGRVAAGAAAGEGAA